jgi:hypothetical protein
MTTLESKSTQLQQMSHARYFGFEMLTAQVFNIDPRFPNLVIIGMTFGK